MTAFSERDSRRRPVGEFIAVRPPELVAAHAARLAGYEMTAFFRENNRFFLRLENLWSPHKYMPNPSSPDFIAQLVQLWQQADTMSPELRAVIAGNYVTELAGENYATALNRVDGYRDEIGIPQTPQAEAIHFWIAEEKSHPELLGKWMFLTGRFNMEAVHKTAQILLRDGFHPGTSNDPYEGFVYTSIQEAATDISHSRTGELARREYAASVKIDVTNLKEPVIFARGAYRIASDESRHTKMYTNVLKMLMELDPDGAMGALANMARKKIVMPGSRMGEELFAGYSDIAEGIGVLTGQDYAHIWVDLLTFLAIEKGDVKTDAGKRDKEWLVRYGETMKNVAKREREPKPIDPNNPAYIWVLHQPSPIVNEKVARVLAPGATVFEADAI